MRPSCSILSFISLTPHGTLAADDKPTPKALSEQLHKYRKNSKGTNNVTLSMGKRKAGDSAQSTPRKRASPKKATPKKAAKEKETVKDEASPVKKESVKEESKYDYA